MKTKEISQAIILIACIIFLPITLHAQKGIKASGKSEVRVESDISKEQAREIAEELAMINAIENEFNTYIEQEADIRVKDGRVNFDIIGSTRVRGEWIRTIRLNYNEEVRVEKGEYGKEQNVWITCNITGEIRKCVSRANLEILALNQPTIQSRRIAFYDAEDMFLYFKSPVDGYLSVFLDDGEKAFRLLPYKSMGTLSAVKVSGDKDYIIFSKNHSYPFDERYSIDALELGSTKEKEYNNIYVVFAENEYVKPILHDIQELDGGYYLPRSLSLKEFKEWLGDCRADMSDFQAKKIKISIEKK